jgi:hypothetical protein
MSQSVFGSQQRGSQVEQLVLLSPNNQIIIQQDQRIWIFSFHFLQELLLKSFLPIGYPSSVRSEYLEYQIYDSIQALCSYLRGVLCTKALFIAAGVGDIKANAMSAAITWMMKDGIGMFFSIIFASTYSPYFGSYIKEWRLFADLINDIALTIDLLTPFFPRSAYLSLLSLSAICKTMCGISANSTKLCITNYLCLNSNEADVNTKEGSQETAICLIGLILGIIISQLHITSMNSYLLFFFLTSLHIYCNYYAIKCLQLQSINRTRGWLLFQASYTLLYLEEASYSLLLSLQMSERSHEEEKIFLEEYYRQYDSSSSSSSSPSSPLSISRINSQDSVFLTLRLVCSQFFSSVVNIEMGVSLQDALIHLPDLTSSASSSSSLLSKKIQNRWIEIQEISRKLKLNYCIVPRKKNGYSVILRRGSTQLDQYEAFCRCLFLEKQQKQINETFENIFWKTSKDFERFWRGHSILVKEEVFLSSLSLLLLSPSLVILATPDFSLSYARDGIFITQSQ